VVEEAQMKTVVVYESMFGNTKTIAEAIAEGLGGAGQVVLGSVDDLSPDQVGDARLLVAGGPTHGHGMASPNAHQAMARDGSYANADFHAGCSAQPSAVMLGRAVGPSMA
jgi:flavorubredoxin